MNNITKTVIKDRLQGLITLAGSIKDFYYRRNTPRIVLSQSEGACTDGKSIWLPVQIVAQDYYNRAKINALLLHERGHNLYTPDYNSLQEREQHELANVVEDIKVDFLTRSLIRSGNSLWVNLVMEYTELYLKRGVMDFSLTNTFNLLILTEGYRRIAIHSGNERLVEMITRLRDQLDAHLATKTTVSSQSYMGKVKAQVDEIFMMLSHSMPNLSLVQVIDALWKLYKDLLKNRTPIPSGDGLAGNKVLKSNSSRVRRTDDKQNSTENADEETQQSDESSTDTCDEDTSLSETADKDNEQDASEKDNTSSLSEQSKDESQTDSSMDSADDSETEEGTFFFDDFKEDLKSQPVSKNIDDDAKDFLEQSHTYEIREYESGQYDGVDFCKRIPCLPSKSEMESFLGQIKYLSPISAPTKRTLARTYKKDGWNYLFKVTDVRKETLKLKNALKAYKPKFHTVPNASGSVLRQNALHRLATGKYEPKPFVKKGKGRDLSTEVCFLLDVSGSMNGSSIISLVKTMSYLQHAISEIKTNSLSTSIYAFEDYCYLVKKPGTPFKQEDLKNIPNPHNSTCGYTAMKQVTRELMKRKANRKIIICLTDGDWTDSNARFNLDVYQSLGIEVYGVYLSNNTSRDVNSLRDFSGSYPNFPYWFVVDIYNIRNFYITLLEELLRVSKD